MFKGFLGELIGTFVLVFIGCGSVGYSLFISPLDLWQIALIWGVGVTLAIWSALPFSHAHLNPAVSIGFLISRTLKRREFLPYLTGQFAGAMLAAVVLYLIFIGNIENLDLNSAMMFGEYYPNPGNASLHELSTFSAFSLECLGTFALMFGILKIIKMKFEKAKLIHPLLIGLLLSILIFCIAPYTQAGFNPARDFGPRLISYLAGWDMAFSYNGLGWFNVYVFGPILGAVMAASFDRKSNLKKMMPVSG